MKHPFRLIDLTTFKKVSSLLAGNYKTSFHGSGVEFADIREYSLGDDTADIDWKTSARTGKVYIKKYEEDRERKVLFVVDVGSSMRFGNGDKTKEDTLREVFSVLLFSSAQNNDPIGAWFFTDIMEKTHKREKGMQHVQKIHEDFEVLLAKENQRGESSLPLAIENLCQKRIRNHLIFIFSDSLELPRESHFRSLAEQNDCVFVHVFDTFENTLIGSSKHIIQSKIGIFLDTTDEQKQRRYVQERGAELEHFRHIVTRLGGSYLMLDETKNVYKELFLFFKKRQGKGL
ncbi:MAG: DUF58 domain-containing protein [Candidatus Gracilibacteria bacterium]|nr:DUF58 domain-containing protein [Candidatus Gracilibacteria bacterium]